MKSKAAAAKRVGITADVFSIPESTTTAELVSTVEAIGRDEHGPVDGILVQLPLPSHVDARAVLDAVPPDRDVDGFHAVNAGLLSQGRPHFIPMHCRRSSKNASGCRSGNPWQACSYRWP